MKGVRGFLGLTGYYRKFIKDYGKIAKPVTDLTKKEGFKWEGKEQSAFEVLNNRVTTAPVDFNQKFYFESDAWETAWEGRPIAYYNKILGERNLTESAYEKELMEATLSI